MLANRRLAGAFLASLLCITLSVRSDCPIGDLNADCQVTLLDVQAFAEQWLSSPVSPADLDGDEEVNLDDFSLLAAHWHNQNTPLLINEFMASNGNYIMDAQGEHEDWIEILNVGGADIDMAGMCLTDEPGNPTKWRFPANKPYLTTIKAGGYLLIWADNDPTDNELHAGFELDADGDQIALFDTDGVSLIDSVEYPKQTTDISYGRYPNATSAWSYFGVPRPWMENVDPFLGVVADTQFSRNRGFYDEPFTLTIATETEGATIYYTVDGSDPSDWIGMARDQGIYTGPLTVTETTCIRAVAIKTGYKPANVDTQTYLFLSDVITRSQAQVVAQGYPTTWFQSYPADYEMDPQIYNDPSYSGLMEDALKALPTISVVTAKAYLFNKDSNSETGGIYIYPGHSSTGGNGWERPISAEFFTADGSRQFQVNCGLRIQGGESRNPPKCPKHSFSLRFRSIYGPGQLDFPLFGNSRVTQFDSIHLRGVFNNAWTHWAPDQRQRTQYIRDQWMRDALLAMGQEDAGQGRFIHLYLNGIYWGVYNLQERPVAAHYAAYNACEEDDVDAVNGGSSTDGTMAAWNEMKSTVAGRDWQQIRNVMDVDSFIDWTILNLSVSNRDLKTNGNWRAAGGGPQRRPWHFYSWDGEHALEGLNESGTRPSSDPSGMHGYLDDIEEFRIRFADRIHKHHFNGGPLTPEENSQRWLNRSNELEVAIVAESARWGDYRRDVHSYSSGPYYLYTRDQFWIPEKNRLLNDYFPARTAIAINQFRSRGMYPNVDAPVFSINGSYRHGGHVTAQDMLSMNSSGGTVYYTLDGSDPRGSDSGSGGDSTVLAAENAPKRALAPTGPVSDAWKGGAPFDDSAWTPVSGGPGAVGYERSSGYQNYITLDVEDQMYREVPGCYVRIPFTLEDDPAAFNQLTLKVRYDDAFVAYLNGVEIYRAGFTGDAHWSSTANGNHEANVFEAFYVSDHLGDLKAGQNVLALHGINVSITSSDFIISAELTATEGSSSGQGSTGAIEYKGPLSLDSSARVKACTLSGSSWSALNEAVYAVGPVADSLRITEIMYHPIDPADPNDPNDPNEEYIELTNVGAETINLNLVTFSNGVDFTFPGIELAPGARTLVVEDVNTFEARYGQGLPIAGKYTGKLANNGERIALADAVGAPIHDFTYSDNWRTITDTDGYSLTIIDPGNPDPNAWAQKDSWRASVYPAGSPGTDDSGILPNPGDIVINEVLAHSHDEASDWIELYNTTDSTISIAGWYLSDSASNLKKYRIAPGTTIAAGQYKVFHEATHFGAASVDPGVQEPFALSENGETFYLTSAISGELTGFRESQDLGASSTGISFGRYFKTSTGNYNFVPMSYPTMGQPNTYPKVGPIVITEISYNPTWPVGGSYTNDQYEFIEIKNITQVSVSLYRYDKSEPWKITDGIDFTFPDAPSVAVLGPGEYLIIAKKPEAFMWRYPTVPTAKVLGPYDGSLDNAGERVQLSSPGDTDKLGIRQYIREDRVVYSDGSHPQNQPGGIDLWPTQADGNGHSLHRIDDNLYANDPNNWQSDVPSPGY